MKLLKVIQFDARNEYEIAKKKKKGKFKGIQDHPGKHESLSQTKKNN